MFSDVFGFTGIFLVSLKGQKKRKQKTRQEEGTSPVSGNAFPITDRRILLLTATSFFYLLRRFWLLKEGGGGGVAAIKVLLVVGSMNFLKEGG